MLLMFSGAYCIFSPATALTTLAVVLAAALLFSALSDIIVYFSTRSFTYGGGWLLASGILGTVAACVLFAHSDVTAAVLPYLLAAWMILAGIAIAAFAFSLRSLGGSSWGAVLAVGIIILLFGVLACIKPVISAVAIGFLFGFGLLLDGLFSVLKAVFVPRLWL